MGRSSLKAPNLTVGDWFIFGYLSLFISARRRLMSAVIVKPSSLLRFHRALVNRKYSRLFSNKGKTLRRGSARSQSSDNDPLFKSHRWQANLRILDVDEVKSIPYTPMSHRFVERVIGAIRREYLGHDPFWNSVDLDRKLHEFKDYYNNYRTHEALSGESPAQFQSRSPQILAQIDDHVWRQHCGGLFQTPAAG